MHLIGILITSESMKRIATSIKNDLCPFKDGYGDIALGFCSRISGVKLGNSLDELGRERFHFASLLTHYRGDFLGKVLKFNKAKYRIY